MQPKYEKKKKNLPVWIYRPLQLEGVGDVNSSLRVDEFQPAGRSVLDPGAVAVCLRARESAAVRVRKRHAGRVVVQGDGWHFRRGGQGRGSIPRDVIGHDEVARARARPNHWRGTRGEPTGCQNEHARPFRPHTLRVTSDGSDGTDTSG